MRNKMMGDKMIYCILSDAQLVACTDTIYSIRFPQNQIPKFCALGRQTPSYCLLYQLVWNTRNIGIFSLKKQRQVPVVKILQHPGIAYQIVFPLRIHDYLMLRVNFALGIEAEILFVPKGKKIAAESPTCRGTPIPLQTFARILLYQTFGTASARPLPDQVFGHCFSFCLLGPENKYPLQISCLQGIYPYLGGPDSSMNLSPFFTIFLLNTYLSVLYTFYPTLPTQKKAAKYRKCLPHCLPHFSLFCLYLFNQN